MPDAYVETRKRGFFGWVFLILFLAWNALMIYWAVKVGMAMGDVPAVTSEAQQTTRDAARGTAMVIVLVVWALGAVITGLLAMLTRGSKVIRRLQG